MLSITLSASARRMLAVAACTGAAVFGANQVAAQPGGGGGGGGGPTCTINSPQNDPTVSAGGAVEYQGSVSGGVSPYSVTWTFEGGDPATASDDLANSGDQTAIHTVVYNTAGTYTTTMSATDSSGKNNGNCSATRTVEVTNDTNSRPVAQNDEYNGTQDATLEIAAPGVLSNDNDPDGDPMSAVLVDTTTNGTLSLAVDGGFSYTPNAGFTGGDSFTYTANDAGGASNLATASINIAAAGAVSINSTSANGALPTDPVPEPTHVSNPNYTLVANNDLGMHCGDLDTRISSILPPFNVMHAQVIERGIAGLPRVMGEGEAVLYYTAASNPDDPAIGKVLAGNALSSVVNGNVYKTNFWDIAFGAYDPFYPDNILDLFYSEANPSANIDVGLPVPDVERFYLEDGELHASQQNMPGILGPYTANDPQVFHEHIGTFPFFLNFPFGYAAPVNFFEAPGVPIAAFDDFGRENPYPLVKVEAHVGGARVATLDTVMPISGEAECQLCHAAEVDGGNGSGIKSLDPAQVLSSIDDPGTGVPFEVSVEWASDNNILLLHDIKHGSTYNCATPDEANPDCLDNGYDATGTSNDAVVCQRCHYTPALDLAQLGPLGPGNDFAADFVNSDVPGGIISSPSVANGRDQLRQPSMSNVMHSHHATVTDANGTLLFPDMPPAIDSAGTRRDPVLTQTILEQTCYRCHPGERTQCMRGAMANGGLVCQDCHGEMAQVGDDFSRNVSPTNVGAFELGPDFYDNPATPRVPWANEPGCGSCHTGYATDNLAGDANVLVNPTDVLGNADDIRLLAAYRTDDTKATPIVPVNKAFAENVVTSEDLPGDPGAVGNPKLYRISTGHGGLYCEACHGSTHAEWPSANPNANDNKMAEQLQGHQGYIAECQVCHEPTDATLPLGNNGPHGMHAISDLEPNLGVNGVDNGTNFVPDERWNLQHRNYKNQGPGCESCHGPDLKGTVLSRTADERTVICKDTKGSLPCADGDGDGVLTAIIPKGMPVGCGLCHRQK